MKQNHEIMLYFILLVFSFPLAIHGHGNMMLPTTWMDPGGKIGLRNQMNCGGAFSSCLWFTNYTFIPGKPSLDPSLWTYSKIRLHDEPVFNPHDLDYTGCKHPVTKIKEGPEVTNNDIPPLKDYFYNHPWRSPGSAKVHSPCGVLGGNPTGCPANAPYGEGNICPGGGFGYGPRAEEFPFRDVVTTKWRAGAVVEVGWGKNYNMDMWIKQCDKGISSCFVAEGDYDDQFPTFRGCAGTIYPHDEKCETEKQAVSIVEGKKSVDVGVKLCYCNQDLCNV